MCRAHDGREVDAVCHDEPQVRARNFTRRWQENQFLMRAASAPPPAAGLLKLAVVRACSLARLIVNHFNGVGSLCSALRRAGFLMCPYKTLGAYIQVYTITTDGHTAFCAPI